MKWLIKAYRRFSYGKGRKRCSATDPFNCSTLALEAMERAGYRKLRAAVFAYLIIGTCAECYDNSDAKPPCGHKNW